MDGAPTEDRPGDEEESARESAGAVRDEIADRVVLARLQPAAEGVVGDPFHDLPEGAEREPERKCGDEHPGVLMAGGVILWVGEHVETRERDVHAGRTEERDEEVNDHVVVAEALVEPERLAHPTSAIATMKQRS